MLASDPSAPPPLPWTARLWTGLRRRALAGVLRLISTGKLTVVLPDGGRIVQTGAAPGPEAEVVLHSWRPVARLMRSGDVGFAESYMDGEWTSPDLTAFIALAAANTAVVERVMGGLWPVRQFNRLVHRLRRNSRSGSRRNIAYHYDLGNAFYRLWLDRDMVYSAARYDRADMSLEDAQAAKLARIVDKLDLAPAHAVLEIGCGWGALARRIAQAGARVTGLTLSKEQLHHAETVIAADGLKPRVDLRLQDYRDVGGLFDRIASIEMFEAVGERYWPAYFRTIRERLKPGGHAVLQIITIAEARFEDYRRNPDFIQRYIFPGGMLPSPERLRQAVAEAGLMLAEVETFGRSYALTLAEWRRRFLAAWPEIRAQGYPERFRRMWEYYLAYCEAGFLTGAIDVGLYTVKPGTTALPAPAPAG
jgi:cyclopropane-fatty-acyl-phospholipid synthase